MLTTRATTGGHDSDGGTGSPDDPTGGSGQGPGTDPTGSTAGTSDSGADCTPALWDMASWNQGCWQ